MSTYTMPEHGAIAYTCDSRGPAGRSPRCCAAGATVRPEQGGLWLDPSAQLPDGWTRRGGGHLCPEHSTQDVLLTSLIWASSTADPGRLVGAAG